MSANNFPGWHLGKGIFNKPADEKKKEELFNKLVDQLYEKGKAIEAAAHLEIDAVIDPAETRSVILKAAR